MAYVLTDKQNYEDIADAIREKNASSETYLPSEMAAAVRAIQTGAVDSVNGKTGAVVLSASDVGAGTYSKPSGGIPKSDLASAVQTSLGKADTALQAAPVTSVNGNTGDVTITPGGIGAATTQDVKKINDAFDNVIPLRSELEYPIQMGTCAFNGPSRSYDIYRANRDIVDAEHDTSDAWTGPRTTASAYAGNVDLALKSLESALAASEAQRLAMYPTDTVDGAIAVISDGADGVPVKALTVDIASGEGVTGATLTRCGKNLLQWPALDSTSRYGVEAAITGDRKLSISGTATNDASTFYSTSRLSSYDTMPLGPFPAGTYSITAKGFVGDAVEDRITATVKTADGATIIDTKISAEASEAADGTGRVVTFSASEPFKVFLWVYIKAGSTIDSQVELQMEYGIGLGAWEAYTGDSWTFDWSDAVGAITEGTLDAVAGRLTTGGQTYDVTPAEVLTLPGVNVIYADCGDVSVTYRADPTDQASVQTRRMALCISTYRDNFRTDASEYYLAVSYDGRSFYELRDSRGFAGDGLVSSDVQPFELDDGLLMICTSFHKNTGEGDTQPTHDFKAAFTRDFKSYASAAVDLGFMDAAYGGEPYVWAPQIVRLDGKYYCIASISTGATVDGDVYTDAGDQSHRTRYLRPYYIEVEISTEGGRLSIAPASGATLQPLKIHADDQDASIMDVSVFYSENRRKLCAVYKDRIYNIVNLSESDTGTIDGTFTDVYTYLGNMAYMEAGYFTRIGGNEYIYLCNYLSRPIVLRHAMYPYYTTKDMIHGWEEVGSVNSGHSFGDGVDAGMRNPYPIELSEKLMRRLLAAYAVPSIIPDYAVRRSETIASMSIVTRISDVIYSAFDKFTEYRPKAYIPSSSKKDGVNCDMCFLNDPATVEIASDGVTTIRTPNGNATVTKSTTDADVFMVTHGTVIKGARNYVG